MNTMRDTLRTPIGLLLIEGDDTYITRVDFVEDSEEVQDVLQGDCPVARCKKELVEYFAGERKTFSVSVLQKGTAFQMKVWNSLLSIPYGELETYKNVAERVGNGKAVRAVGGANHRNRIVIIVPCHRVVGSSGKLVGYGGGLDRKEWLIQHEEKYKQASAL